MKPTLQQEIADMGSVKGEYVRLMYIAIAESMEEVLKRIKEPKGAKPLEDIVLEAAVKCYEISNADFVDNYNPQHREEQPF